MPLLAACLTEQKPLMLPLLPPINYATKSVKLAIRVAIQVAHLLREGRGGAAKTTGALGTRPVGVTGGGATYAASGIGSLHCGVLYTGKGWQISGKKNKKNK